MNKQKRKKRKIPILLWCIWICALTFVILNATTQSSYMSKTQNGNGSVEIAKPIITMSKTILNDFNNNPSKKTIDFTVQNYEIESEELSEVTMSYFLSIEKNVNVPVTYKLYKNNEEVILTNNKTTEYTLPHTTKMQDDYRLELIFTASPSNEDIQHAISIVLNSAQIQ